MKLLHSGSLDVNLGGPAISTYNILWRLHNFGVYTQFFMYPISKNGRLRGTDMPVYIAQLFNCKKICGCI